MANSASAQFVGDIPQFYDQYLGPILFQDYAADLARRAASHDPKDVLEIAAGTGISTVALRRALPASAHLVVTDLNAPMLEIARTKLSGSANVVFQQADAMALPFDDASFDLIAIQFGAMFFPDKAATFAQMRRVLRPGGVLIFNVWSTMEANPFSQAAYAAGAHFLPDNPPKFYLTPFGYADIAQVRADVLAGGFSEVTQDVVGFNKGVSSWDDFATGAVLGNPLIADLKANAIDPMEVVAWLSAALRRRFGNEPAHMPLEAIVLTAQ